MADEIDEVSWQEEAGLQDDTNMAKFESVGDLAKSYNESQSALSKGIRIPGEDAGEEAMDKFYTRLEGVNGVMRTPEGYSAPPSEVDGYTFTDVEGAEVDANTQADFKALSLELGLNSSQADKVHSFIGDRIVSEMKDINSLNEDGMTKLSELWGNATEQKKVAAKNIMAQMEDQVPGVTAMVDGLSAIGHDATGIQLMNAIAEMMGEAGITPNTHRTMVTPQEASEQLTELRNNPDYVGIADGHPKWAEFQKKRHELIRAGARASFGAMDGY